MSGPVDRSAGSVDRYFRKCGILLFVDTDGHLSAYPKRKMTAARVDVLSSATLRADLVRLYCFRDKFFYQR